ncbi:MAG: hypothetical protein HQK52_20510 [Oligoflexia bacterium]|nr:hypothetical protein [Oligoflexia bacterium]
MTTTPLLQTMDDQELIKTTLYFSQKERYYTKILLDHLMEIEDRRIHLKLGYESLFAYCTRELSYSEAEALTRIGAMRLLRKIPEAAEKIAQGQLTLTNASLLQGHLRRQEASLPEKKENSKEEELQLLAKCSNTSARKCKEMLEEIEQKARGEEEEDRTVTITLKVKQSVLKKIQEVKKERGVKSEAELIELLCKEELKREKKKQEKASEKETVLPPATTKRCFPEKMRKELLKRAGHQCCYISPLTGRRCEGTSELQADHVYPAAWGGETSIENGRMLCRGHNQLLARECFGDHKVDAKKT